MSSRFSPPLRRVLGLLTVAAALSLTGPSRGQDDIPGNNEKAVEKEYQDNRTLLNRLLRGDEPFSAENPKHAAALDAAAKYSTYRFTWVTYESEPSKIDEVYRNFEEQQLKQIQRSKAATQPQVANAYSKAIGVRAREVLGSDKAIARVNAARVLAKVAELGQGDLADALLDVFEKEVARPRTGAPRGGERNDGVIYYTLRGMRELLAVPNPAPPAPPVLSAERELKLTQALLAFVTKPVKFTTETPKDEVEGYRAMRREAVRALAYCRAPSLKGKERPGMVLLRVAANDDVTPEARVDERLEAAIGVARMREATDGKEFQPEYAAYQLGLFLDYFASYYAENSLPREDRPREQRPFKIYAARLLEALDAMKAETKNAYVAASVDQYRKLLAGMEKGEAVRTLDLTRWLDKNPPPKDTLFQGVADSTVKPANRRGDMP
jgi:cytochrome c556